MNFSDRSKLKKYISLGLSVCLVAALFTGCKKEDDTPDTSADNTPNLNLNLSSSEPSTVPTESAPTEPTVVINEKTGVVLSDINVRGTPSQDATVTATLSAGDRVEVVRRETLGGVTWGYITQPQGWIVMDYVKMDMEQTELAGSDTSTPAGNGEVAPPVETTAPTNTTEIKGVITGSQVNIRSEPSTTGKIQGSYNRGDTVTILETRNGWGRTNKGWVKMDYVNTTGTTTNTDTNTNTNTNSNVTGNGSTTVQFRGIVIAKELNIRANASQNSDRVGSYTYGKRVEFYEKDGNWGRTKDGWISLSYVYQDGATGTNTATGTVTTDGLRIRSGPGTGYDVVGSVNNGDTVQILEQFTYGDTTWGCIKNGWISMSYVDVDGKDDDDDNGTWGNTVEGSQSGTIIGNGVRIRSGAGTNYGVVGSYDYGDRVTVYERKTADGIAWGRVDNGWVSMDYVELD